MVEKKNERNRFRLRINVEINEDIEFELNKVSNKRKITISQLINEILKDWVEEQDMKQFEKGK